MEMFQQLFAVAGVLGAMFVMVWGLKRKGWVRMNLRGARASRDSGSRLEVLDRLVLTPHSAFYTPESMRDNRAFSARTAARFLRDGRLENCVNKQFLVTRS